MNFKVSDEGRLSSSKATHYLSGEKTAFAAIEALVPDEAEESEADTYDYFGKRNNASYCLIPAEAIRDPVFDRVNQVLAFEFISQDVSIPALIPYSEINLQAIKFIEATREFPRRIFVCQREKRGWIPLSMVTDTGVENFYFS
jgi:hypothetical protein